MATQNREIFISYAWGGESENMVDEIEKTFNDKGINIIRDKRDLGFKGIITDFMRQIGEGKAVITVISDNYLKSPYCMYELLEIYRNLKFYERIFPIVLGDAKIFDPLP
jgi:internalin A